MSSDEAERAQLAWAVALEAAAQGVYHYQGLTSPPSYPDEVPWEATAAFVSGLLALADGVERHDIPWARLLTLARAERRQLAVDAMPAPRGPTA